ncbi:MAG TPA: hypothetical protein VGV89_07245 [Thermoplasmata archaeon]|nr:hypothetical protein [Thermoplasmata archaeon]
MARRYRRDLIGHFIRNRQPAQQMCTHACCRGYRVHPANMPVILPNRLLRSASESDLAKHYDRVAGSDSDQAQRAEAQILHELERRDEVDAARRRRRTVIAGTRAAQRMEHEAERERVYQAADDYTRGNWVNRKGQARGINADEILTGREAVFQRYASEEARAYFREHARPTAAYFRGRDTRIAYSDQGTRRRSARPSEHWINRPVGRRRGAA